MTIRVGMIGLGDIAHKAYLPVLGAHADAELVAVQSRSAETVDRIAGRYRIANAFTEREAFLRTEMDAVFVHSPTGTHEEVVTACLERGLHVYVDKPLSYDIGASERMAELAAKRGLLLAVGFNRRFAPLYAEAKAWIEEAGGFDFVIAQKHRTRQQGVSAKLTLYDDLIHMLDLLLWLGAEPAEVASWLQETSDDGRLLHASGVLRFGRREAVFGMNRRAGADLERLELHGGGRSAEIVNLETAVWRDKVRGETRSAFGGWEPIAFRRGFAGAVDHFLASLAEPERCLVKADRVLDSHRLIERLGG
ncbi:Gfo/Idh/MocA family protein [Cohnella sp. REN36]|uniref:Gfo/Idh/MocA family protein n=1 Tax=Cohnella sp. REN36 TaxID=2887347 RepID=UPI001D143905|nr:Gfo/Idh/MocA family oxidoreductase [Cohnella sp. REN36]MCC3371728.1 Gfo/Idh/MocA family oxidoreductase [Cohnella sp. REN36]